MFHMERWLYVYIFSVSLFIFYVNSQQSTHRLECESILNCGSCLQQLGCVWCTNPRQSKTSLSYDPNTTLSHCIHENTVDIQCFPSDLKNKKTKGDILDDEPLQSKTGKIVQMRPQRIRLDLKKGQSYELNFQYRQAENYPVDLYYIIDNSYSMRVHKDKLASLGTKLAAEMRQITNNFRIGFGSFVDKVVIPFESTVPRRLKYPCSGTTKCVPPYSFKNHMSLSTNFEEFADQVRKAMSSGSLDHPEGGFDAIMQAIACKSEIGWRDQARHLILFSTDAEFHIAGDGKLGGIIETNDAKCHMENNSYDGLHNDYPSVSQLNYFAKENYINLIFAVPKGKQALGSYKLLSKGIENSKVDTLDADSKNVIRLVVDNYEKIRNSITIQTNATKNIQVQITPRCKYPIPIGCDKIKLGEEVDITATFKLLKCEENLKDPIIISLKPDGVNESLIVEVHPVCQCDCESHEHRTYTENATECAGQGNLVCGVCKCHEHRHGSKCECSKTNTTEIAGDNCRANPGDTECSGLGSCICGMCVCNRNVNTGKKFRGKYCNCDDDSCERKNDILCGGKGMCDCGKCICDAGWEGSSCSCPDNNRTCIREGQNDICSGKGSCSCGKCECYDGYTGTLCEVCPTCAEKCVVIQDCVECTVFKAGIYNSEQCKLECVAYNIKSVDGDIVDHENEKEKICRAVVNKCEIMYKYEYDNLENLIITVRKDQNCEPNLLVWVLTVIGSVLLIGLLTLLIWKLVTTFHDRREFQKFSNEQKQSKWHRNDNPLYKNATTTFENPYYPH